ncbi:MAG: hypothetical protein ACLQIB_53380 [Isosphaeraceae bacterium]
MNLSTRALARQRSATGELVIRISIGGDETVGVTSELVVADEGQATEVLRSDNPAAAWDGFTCKGLDDVRLVTLWSLIDSGTTDDRISERLDGVKRFESRDANRWVMVLPTRMVESLASVASLEREEFDALVEKWVATEEFDGWEKDEVDQLLREVGDLAETANLVDSTMMLWVEL